MIQNNGLAITEAMVIGKSKFNLPYLQVCSLFDDFVVRVVKTSRVTGEL